MSTDTEPRDPSARVVRASAADLVGVVQAVPGVHGIEAGVASTLRTIDARLRRSRARSARYGLVVDEETRTVTVEVGLTSDVPVRRVVEAIQRAVQAALEPDPGTGDGPEEPWQVLVRVQSLTGPAA